MKKSFLNHFLVKGSAPPPFWHLFQFPVVVRMRRVELETFNIAFDTPNLFWQYV
jgi:hypothetical protein